MYIVTLKLAKFVCIYIYTMLRLRNKNSNKALFSKGLSLGSQSNLFLHTRYVHLRFCPGIEILILPKLSR